MKSSKRLTRKINAVKINTFFLPILSINTPFISAPKTAPKDTEATKNPRADDEISKLLFIYKSAPDITPVSYPLNNPPKDAQSAQI